MPRKPRASFVMLSIASLALGSCYSFATPSYHPGEARDLVTAIARQGLTIHSTIPGDSACDDPGLIANATRFAITDPADDMDRDVWLYTFRERYWDASRTAVDACQAVFEAANPGSTVTRIDIPLYRAFGADWSAGLTTSLEAALADAADAGRP